MRPTPILALLLYGSAASAEISPEALWQRWQSGAGAVTALQGEARREDGALVIEDAVLRLGRSDGAPRLHAAALRLAAEGDATRITPPAEWRIDGGEGVVSRVTAPELDLVVSGAPENPVYRIEEPVLGATATIADPDVSLGLTLTATELAATIDPTTGLDLSAATATLRAVPDGGPESLQAAYEGLSMSFDGPLAAVTAPASEGVPYAIEFAARAGRQVLTGPTEAAGTVTATISSGPSRSSIVSTERRIEAHQSLSGVSVTAEGPAVPLSDARVDIAALTLALSTPAAPVEGPAPVALDLAVTGLAPSEEIWQIADPARALPRDPAELRLSVSGTLSWQGEEEPPLPAVERATLETLRLSALGATLTGQGGVQFQPPATPEAPGRPLGALAFTLTGANTLLDRLARLPSVPQGQLMGLRMGLGVFTRPGEGEDTLVSEIEFAPDGSVVVNGTVIGRRP